MRRRVVGFTLLTILLLLVAAGIIATVWRAPLAESVIATYVERTYGVPVEIAIDQIGKDYAHVSRLKLGTDAPFEATDVGIAYALDGSIARVTIGSATAHGRIEGGSVTLGDLEPILASGGDEPSSSAPKLPDEIAVQDLKLALATPLGPLGIAGSATLGRGTLALDLTAEDDGGHTTGSAKIDISDALGQPLMTGDVRLALAPRSPLWAFAPAIAPQAGSVEARLQLEQVAASIDPASDGKPIAVELRLDKLQRAGLAAPLSGALTAKIHSTHLPLSIENVALDLTGGLSPKAQAKASGNATLAFVQGGLALDLALHATASDEAFTVAGWLMRAPTIDAPVHATFVNGELAAALSADGKVTHKGISDTARSVTLGPGGLTLLGGSTAFRLESATGHWKAGAITGPLAIAAKSLGEAVTLKAPALNIAAERDDAGTRWHANASKVAFENKARGVSASNAIIGLAGEGETITGDVRISKFEAGYGLPTITLNGDGRLSQGKLTAQLNAITGAGGGVKLGAIKLNGTIANQKYVADLDMGPITFAPKGLQPSHLFPASKGFVRDIAGTVRLAGPVTWSRGKASSALKLGIEGLTGEAGPVLFQNLNGVIEIDEPWPVSTRPGQEIAVEQLIAGLPMTNALVRFELDGDRAKIEEGRLDMAGGRASIAPTEIALTGAGQRLQLNIDQLSVSELFKVAGVAGLSGEGAISGTAPITLFPNGIIVDNAHFAAEQPGVLKYDAAQAPAALSSAGESVGLALQALSDFHYKELSVTLNRKLTGDTDLALHINGSNPSFYNGYPVEFNLTLSGKLDEVLRKGLAGYRLPSIIEERLNELE